MRERLCVSVSPTARLSILNPREWSIPAMVARTPGWFCTRAESTCRMEKWPLEEGKFRQELMIGSSETGSTAARVHGLELLRPSCGLECRVTSPSRKTRIPEQFERRGKCPQQWPSVSLHHRDNDSQNTGTDNDAGHRATS